MSIRQVLISAIRAEKLRPFLRPLGWEGSSRAFLMTGRLADQMNEAQMSTDIKHLERWEALKADIARFVENGRVDSSMMKQLESRKFEHWEFRSVRPKPSIRVFGRFAEPGVFVATHAVERAFLKEKWNMNWELAKLECEDEWKRALEDCVPFSAQHYESYITGDTSKTVRMQP